MREPAGRLVPSRRSAPVLALLWTLACAGIFAMHGIGVRLFVGTLFSAVLLWLAFWMCVTGSCMTALRCRLPLRAWLFRRVG